MTSKTEGLMAAKDIRIGDCIVNNNMWENVLDIGSTKGMVSLRITSQMWKNPTTLHYFPSASLLVLR